MSYGYDLKGTFEEVESYAMFAEHTLKNNRMQHEFKIIIEKTGNGKFDEYGVRLEEKGSDELLDSIIQIYD